MAEQGDTGVFAANCENCGHLFKYKADPPFKTRINFTVNGVAYTGVSSSYFMQSEQVLFSFLSFVNFPMTQLYS